MKTANESLCKFLDSCRGSAFELKTILFLVYVLWVWKNRKNMAEPSFSRFYQGELSGKKLSEAFRKMSEKDELFGCFLRQEGDPSRFSSEELASIFNFVNSAKELPKVGAGFGLVFDRFRGFAIVVADEVADLACKIAAVEAKSIYSPFTQSLNFVYSIPDKSYYLEDSFDLKLFAKLVEEVDNVNIHFEQSDPLLTPAYVQEKASHILRKFDAGVCFPPFGLKPQKTSFNEVDKYQRFRFFEGKGSLEIAYIEHLLAQVLKKAVLLLPNGMTFRSGIDQQFRKFLVQENLIDAVVQLPSGVLANTAIETILLVLNKQKSDKNILFVNAKNEKFVEVKNRKTVLTEIDQLVDLVLARKELKEVSCLASPKELGDNDYNLSADRYVLSDKAEKLNQLLSGMKLVKLENVADLKRSQAMPVIEDGTEFCELSPGDLPDYGYVQPAGRVKKIDTSSSRFETYRLKTGDLILSTRGTIGKVGLIGEETNFIASQSFQIIRPNGGIDDAKFLYLFFKTDMGNSLLNQISSGTTIPQITPSELAKLEVPWPNAEVRKKMIRLFEKEIYFNKKMEEMKTEIQELRANFFNGLK